MVAKPEGSRSPGAAVSRTRPGQAAPQELCRADQGTFIGRAGSRRRLPSVARRCPFPGPDPRFLTSSLGLAGPGTVRFRPHRPEEPGADSPAGSRCSPRGGCGEVIGADSGCGPAPAPGTRRGRRPGRGPQSCGSASSTRKALPAGAARQCPRPGARDSGTAGPNLPAAARPAPASAPHSPLQHGRPQSAGNTAQFRFRLIGHAHHIEPPPPPPLSATPLPTLERGNRGPGRARQGAPPGRLRRAEAAPFPGNGLRVAGSGADSGTMSGRAGRRRLVLHVDLNNTVVAADAVSGLGPREALNIFLSTATWGREGADGERRARGPGAGGRDGTEGSGLELGPGSGSRGRTGAGESGPCLRGVGGQPVSGFLSCR